MCIAGQSFVGELTVDCLFSFLVYIGCENEDFVELYADFPNPLLIFSATLFFLSGTFNHVQPVHLFRDVRIVLLAGVHNRFGTTSGRRSGSRESARAPC